MPPRYTRVSPNSAIGQMLNNLQPGEEASVVSPEHYGKTGSEVDADLYRRNSDGSLVRENYYHEHLNPDTLNPR